MNAANAGFTLVEVLIAVALVGLVIGSVVVGSVNLSSVNARAQLQSLEATAARAVALRYAAVPLSAGQTLTGPVGNLIALGNLTTSERDLINRFNYTLEVLPSQGTLTIYRRDLSPDPSPLTITAHYE